MIGYIKGHVVDPSCILTDGGVGYTVHTPHPLPVGNTVHLWIHTVISDNAITCYGFTTPVQRTLFAALLKVPGIGGRTAADILAAAEPDAIAAAASNQDTSFFTAIRGIGKNTATKLVATLTIPPELTHAGTATMALPSSRASTTGDDIVDTIITITAVTPELALDTVTRLRATHTDEPSLISAAIRELTQAKATA